MKIAATLTAITLGMATAGMAYADSLPDYPATPAAATNLTHAQVVQEMQAVRASGIEILGHQPFYPSEMAPATESRAQVLAELHQAQQQGQLQLGEQPDYPRFAG